MSERAPKPSGLDGLVPGIATVRRYRRIDLRGDVLAGLTVAAYLIPQVMAYAKIVNLPPITGLWTSLGPLIIYFLLGSSARLSVGPEATMALMTAAALAPMAAGDPARYLALAALLAILVAIVCFIGGGLRLGFLADLLSRPVLTGYLAGVGLLMIIGQLAAVTGVHIIGTNPVDNIRSFATSLDSWHWPTLMLAAITLGAMLIGDRLLPTLPWPLISVILVAVGTGIFGLHDHGIAVVGQVPTGLPPLALPHVHTADILALLLPAVSIAFIGYTENVLSGRAFGGPDDGLNANREWIALGAANLVAGLTRGFPVASSSSRAALAVGVGARTRLYGLVTVLVLLIVVMAGGPVLATFPTAALGALVVYAALKLIRVKQFVYIWHFARLEALIAVITTISVLLFGLLAAVLAAISLSILNLFRTVARPHDGVLGYVPGLAGMHDIDDFPRARQIPGLVVYRFDAPLCFANAGVFARRATRAVTDAGTVHWLVLNAEANVGIDITASDALKLLQRQMAARGVTLVLARVKQELRVELDKAGIVRAVGTDHVFPTLPTAVRAYLAWYRHRFGQLPSGVKLRRGPQDPSVDGASHSGS